MQTTVITVSFAPEELTLAWKRTWLARELGCWKPTCTFAPLGVMTVSDHPDARAIETTSRLEVVFCKSVTAPALHRHKDA